MARESGADRLSLPGACRASFHLLLCGRPIDRDARQLVAVRRCYASTAAVHHLTYDARPRPLHDIDGQTVA